MLGGDETVGDLGIQSGWVKPAWLAVFQTHLAQPPPVKTPSQEIGESLEQIEL